jgi:hypothetical protein
MKGYFWFVIFGVMGMAMGGLTQEAVEPPPPPPAPPTAATTSSIELQKLVDAPTAGCLKKGQYSFELQVYPQGGVLAGFAVGLFDRFTMGVSYGGIGIIGSQQVDWNEQPGVLLKYRLFEESILMPAVALGFSNQGYGAWLDKENQADTAVEGSRYEFKAKGMFAVAGKNFAIKSLGTIGFHGGVTYNAIENNDDGNLDGFVGVDKSLNEELTVLLEYDLGTNDDGTLSVGRDRGYLNGAVHWTIANKLAIDILLKDLLNNRRDASSPSREIRITYTETL